MSEPVELFSKAINNRNKLKFLYNLNEIELEPYYLSFDRNGKKVVFGRVNNSHIIKKFEFEKIINIRILSYTKFSPIIPILN